MTDARMIFVLFVIMLFAIFADDGAEQRWCDTYQFCEDQANLETNYETEKL